MSGRNMNWFSVHAGGTLHKHNRNDQLVTPEYKKRFKTRKTTRYAFYPNLKILKL
jgi:hypothetical protein